MLIPFVYRKKLKFLRYYHNIIKNPDDIHKLISGNLNELKTVQDYLDEDETHYLNSVQISQVEDNVAWTLLLSLIVYNLKNTINNLNNIEIVKILVDNKDSYRNTVLSGISYEIFEIVLHYPDVSTYIN